MKGIEYSISKEVKSWKKKHCNAKQVSKL